MTIENLISNAKKTALIGLTALTVGLASMAYDADAQQSTIRPTDDVHSSTPIAAYPTDRKTLGDVVDATSIGNNVGLLRDNGLFTIYDSSYNLLSILDTGFSEPAWVTKIGDDYWFGHGLNVSKGHFSGNNFVEDEFKAFFGLSDIMTAGDYDPELGLYFSDGDHILRADFKTGDSYPIINQGADALSVLSFEPGVYSNDHMLQIDGFAYRNLDADGNPFGDTKVVDLENVYDIVDVTYSSDRMAVHQGLGTQEHNLPEYANNFDDPAVPEPGAVGSFLLGIAYLGNKLRKKNQIKD